MENMIQPIRAETVEAHREAIDTQIARLGLEYVNRLFSKQIPPMEQTFIDQETRQQKPIELDNLGFLVDEYSSVLNEFIFLRSYQYRNSNDDDWRKERKESREFLIKSINEFYNADPNSWVDKTLELLEEARTKKKKFESSSENSQNLENNNNVARPSPEEISSRKIGLFKFDVSSDLREFFENTDMKVRPGEELMAIHLDPLFAKNYGALEQDVTVKEFMQKLSLQIVDKFPQVKAVMARSWLMDTVIAEKLGFKIYKKEKYVNTPAFWWQFVTKDGQLDKSRVTKFLETGEAPYQVATGAIDTIDFLKKYLPKEKKGMIVLKELNPEFSAERFEKEILAARKIRKSWDGLSVDELREKLKEIGHINELYKKAGVEKDFIEHLLELKAKGVTSKGLDDDETMGMYIKSLTEYAKEHQFINKEVVIE